MLLLRKLFVMAFEIHRGICSCGCGREGIVCIKKGYIVQCNHRIKNQGKIKVPKIIVPKTAEEKHKIFDKLKKQFDSRKLKQKPLKRKAIKKKFRKSKGKLSLFEQIYEECGGICFITGDWFPFDINSFMHILSHGAFERFEFYKKNIPFVNPRIHHLYDNSSKEKLLQEFPEAIKIYEMKDLLKIEYKDTPIKTNKI